LCFLPFDALAGAAVYLLAAQVLKRPLWPALIALAGPAYVLTMQLDMPDKPAAAFALTSLWLLMRWARERRPLQLWSGAALLAAALLAKPTAVFVVPVAALYAWARKTPLRPTLIGLALVCAPAAGLAILARSGASATG